MLSNNLKASFEYILYDILVVLLDGITDLLKIYLNLNSIL